jgi:phage/plasmid-associated DNA primase
MYVVVFFDHKSKKSKPTPPENQQLVLTMSENAYSTPNVIVLVGMKRCREAEPEEARKRHKEVTPTCSQMQENMQENQRNAQLAELLQCLNPVRAQNYGDWFDVLCVIANAAPAQYQLFDDWSKLNGGGHYDSDNNLILFKGVCKNDKYQGRKLKWGSLHLWAKTDNFDVYQRRVTDAVIRKHWQNGQAGMSIIAAHFLRTTVACTDSKKGAFWMYDDSPGIGLWKAIDQNLMLKVIRVPIDSVFEWVERERKRSAQQDTEEQQKAFSKKATGFWGNAVQTKWKEFVIKELRADLHDDEFTIKLDMLNRMYSAANGLVDCTTGQLRPRTPEDYCSKRSKVVYDPDADASKLVTWLTDVFTNDDIPDTAEIVAFLQLLIGGMVAGMANEMQLPAAFFTGNGGNGKGVLLSIVRKMFDGVNAAQGSSTVLSSDIICGSEKYASSNGATPELAKCEGMRLGVVAEITKSTELMLNTNFKNMVGSDDNVQTARHLFQNSREFIMNISLIIACNKMPTIPTGDGDVNSFLRRMVVFPFKNEYKDDSDHIPYNKQNPNHRWKDAAKCKAVTENMSGVLAWAIQGSTMLIEKGRLGEGPATCKKRMKQATDDSNWIDKFEFVKAENGKPLKMKVKDIRQYITEHFGYQFGKALKNQQILEGLSALGCWSKIISRVDYVLAVRIKREG